MTHPILRPARRASPLAAVLSAGLVGCAHVPDLEGDDASARSFVYPDGRGDYAPGNPVVGIDGELYLCLSADACNSENELLHAPGAGALSAATWKRL